MVEALYPARPITKEMAALEIRQPLPQAKAITEEILVAVVAVVNQTLGVVAVVRVHLAEVHHQEQLVAVEMVRHQLFLGHL